VEIEFHLGQGVKLPEGLTLDKETGQLTGTPKEERAKQKYRINAQTADGHTVTHCDVEFSVKSTAGATTISARVTKNMLKIGDKCTTEDMPEDLRKGYEPGEVIGKGGFGTVVEITHKSSRIQYALKMIASESESGFDEKTKKRLQREAGMLREVDSPHVVGINEEGFTDDDRLFFMVMELLKGEPLDVRIDKRDYMTESEAAIAGMHVIRGLVEIHKKGVMHRDIKPGNIICTPDETQQGIWLPFPYLGLLSYTCKVHVSVAVFV
jgi:serine/threonine protein kinase